MQTSPGLAELFIADLPSLDQLDGNLAVVFAIALIVFLLPHWAAARALAPEPTPGRVVATATIQLGAILLAAALQAYSVTLFGSTGATLAGISLILIFALITAAIYNFGFFRGLGYNLLVGGMLLCVGWVADRFLFTSEGGLIAKIWGPTPAETEAASGKPAPEAAEKKQAPTSTSAPATPAKITTVSVPRFATVQDAQAAALARYPDLAKPESAFNRRFLEKHSAYKAKSDALLNGTDWPMRIANEVATETSAR